MNQQYVWKGINLDDHRFLSPLADFFSEKSIKAFLEESQTEFSRIDSEGVITAVGNLDGNPVGIIYSDFRVNAASYGHRNSQRFVEFLKQLQEKGWPAVFIANTMGLSLMTGRKIFHDSFSIWPAILKFSQKQLLITIAVGKCLGLGPVLFAHGHYRMAVQDETFLNLTGPEVLKQFFGKNFDFADFASAERQAKTTDLIHEIVESKAVALDKAKGILRLYLNREFQFEGSKLKAMSLNQTSVQNLKMNLYLDEISKLRVEFFESMDPMVRIFLVERKGEHLGVFISPPDSRNGMITVSTLQKYAAGFDLFQKLGVPVVSLLDAPGIDPRPDQSDKNVIRVMMDLGEKIIDYPHGHMGIAIGRVYGGATTLSFPRNFGGYKSLALKGARLGTMHESLIQKIFEGSPRLLKQWHSISTHETAEMQDLIDSGNIDRVIEMTDIGTEIDDFLEWTSRNATKNLRYIPKSIQLDRINA